MTTVPFEARRFQSTADYYLRYRVPYPDTLIARVADRSGLQIRRSAARSRLRTRPSSASPSLSLGAKVTAMDPEPEMLSAATEGARKAGVEIDRPAGLVLRSWPGYRPPQAGGHGPLLPLDGSAGDAGSARQADRCRAAPSCCSTTTHLAMVPDWREIVEQLGETFSPERSADSAIRQSSEWPPHESDPAALRLQQSRAHRHRSRAPSSTSTTSSAAPFRCPSPRRRRSATRQLPSRQPARPR